MPRRPKKHREGGANRRVAKGTNTPLTARSRASLALTDRLARLVPRDELLAVLEAAAHGDPARAEKFRLLLGDLVNPLPGMARKSFTSLAWERGLRYPEMLDAVRRYRLDAALLRSTEHLDAVLEGLAEDAKRREVGCLPCGGLGYVQRKSRDAENKEVVAEEPCPVCKGKGTVMEPGDPQARRLYAEAHGLVGGGKGGPTINISQQQATVNAGAEAAGGLEELLRRTRQAQLPAQGGGATTTTTTITVEKPDGDDKT